MNLLLKALKCVMCYPDGECRACERKRLVSECDEARRLAEHYLDIIARHGIAVDEEYRLPWPTD